MFFTGNQIEEHKHSPIDELHTIEPGFPQSLTEFFNGLPAPSQVTACFVDSLEGALYLMENDTVYHYTYDLDVKIYIFKSHFDFTDNGDANPLK